MLERALRRSRPGPYQVQAAIAACHATATRRRPTTDWGEIAGLYGELAKMNASPVVELNRAVAVAMADGPDAGLAIVDALDASGALDGYHLLPATRADLLRRLGRRDEAADAYRAALALATSDADRRYLSRRLDEITRSASTLTRRMTLSAPPALNHSICSALNVCVHEKPTVDPSGLVMRHCTTRSGASVGEVEQRDAIVLTDLVVGRRVGEREGQDSLLLQVGLVDAGEAAGEDHDTAAIARLHRRVLA